MYEENTMMWVLKKIIGKSTVTLLQITSKETPKGIFILVYSAVKKVVKEAVIHDAADTAISSTLDRLTEPQKFVQDIEFFLQWRQYLRLLLLIW